MNEFVSNKEINENDMEYELYGISNHSGSLNSGHCTASCKNPDD
jgi:ubiquitin C-terminal hydrolase